MGRIVLHSTRQSRRRLKRLAQKSRDARRRTRILIVLHYQSGWGANRIATALDIVPSTAVKVARRYQLLADRAFDDGRASNGQRKVDEDLLQALSEILRSDGPRSFGWRRPTWTRELLIDALFHLTRVRVSRTTLLRMLRSIGVSWKTARPIVRCPWGKRRKLRRIEGIQRILNSLKPEQIAFFEDEVDIHLNPKIGRGWVPKGQAREIVTPGQNKKHYMAGALSACGQHLCYVTARKKTSALFIKLLEKLRRDYSDYSEIHLILDNYAIHKSQVVRRYLAQHSGVFHFHFLPPYSPEHNRIERLWWDLHANVTRNHRHKTLCDLLREVHGFMQKERRRRSRLPPSELRIPAA